MKLLALLCLIMAPLAGQDLSAIRAEPNPEKRAEKALKAAEDSFSVARKAAQAGKTDEETQALGGIRSAVELAMQSLEGSGKDARRSPKYFKKAEITLRKLIRQLSDFEFAKGVDERKPVTELIAYLRETQDKVLVGIMTKKK